MVTKKKKPAKKASKKAVTRIPSKAVKKQLKSISRKLEKNKKQSSKRDRKLKAAVARTKAVSEKVKAELEKLREDLKKSKGKRSKKQLSEYNLFMRRQLLEGKTFNQAIRLWQKLRRVEEGKIPTRTKIKTVVKKVRVKSKPRVVVRTRRVLVKSKPKIRTRTVVKTRTVVRKAKPIVKYKTRTKIVRQIKPVIKYRVRTKTVEKPVIKTVEKPVLDTAMMERLAEQISTDIAQKMGYSTTARIARTETTVSTGLHELATEEMAYRMVKMYFEELARIGFKRQMSLDDLVDAFIYSWYRVEKRLGRKHETVHKEEMAYRIVNLYFIELARVGHKRTLNLDELLDSFFYVLDRLEKDNTELIQKMEAARLSQTSTTTTVTTTTTQAPSVPTPVSSP